MKLKLLLSALLFCATIKAQSPPWQWAKSVGGTSYEFANCVTTSPSGEIVVAGSFNSASITFGSTVLTNTVSGVGDIFVAKYDAAGNVIWAHSAGGAADDYANSATVDLNGNVYVTGNFSSATMTAGLNILVNADNTTASTDIFLLKYNSSGVLQWAKRMGGTDWEIGQGVTTDPLTGDVYIGGGFASPPFSFASGTIGTNGGVDVLLCKYDPAGNEIWARTAGGSLNDLANGVGTDSAGYIYLPGGFASATTTFGSTTLTNVGAGYPDIFFTKYDASGNVIWATREGGTNNDHAIAVSKIVNNEVYITGHYHSPYFVAGNDSLVNGGMGDIFVMKYDTAGNLKWARSHGGMDMDFALAVCSDATGNAYVSGMFTSDTIHFGSQTLVNASMSQDVFVTEYDSAGNTLWAARAGGAGDDFANGVAVDNVGNVYLAGAYSSTSVPFGSTTLTNADTTGNTHDLFVAKMGALTGISPVADANSILLYPNPSSGAVFIQLPTDLTGKKITADVYDETGKLVLSCSGNKDGKMEINVNTGGIYFVLVKDENGIIIGKPEFIKTN